MHQADQVSVTLQKGVTTALAEKRQNSFDDQRKMTDTRCNNKPRQTNLSQDTPKQHRQKLARDVAVTYIDREAPYEPLMCRAIK